MDNFEDIIKQSESILEDITPFLNGMETVQDEFLEEENSSNPFRNRALLYFKCSDYDIEANKLLIILRKFLSVLSSSINQLEKKITQGISEKNALSAKWNAYVNLSAILRKVPNADVRKIRFEMHAIYPNWENSLDESTMQILLNMETGFSKNSELRKNLNNIFNSYLNKNGRFSVSNFSEISTMVENYQKQKEEITTLFSKISEKTSILEELINRSPTKC